MEKDEQIRRDEKNDLEDECSAFASRVSELVNEKEKLINENQSLSDTLAENIKKNEALIIREQESVLECEAIKKKAQEEADEKISRAEIKAHSIINDAEDKSKQLLDNANESVRAFADEKRDELNKLLDEIQCILDDLTLRSSAVSSGLDVSKRHIEGVNRRFEKILCSEDEQYD
ncbi:MAG TPA: hypothetical protein PLT66_06100 [Bacillota bacterium]|nr:hypothetical protein [Bacillota bacterium]